MGFGCESGVVVLKEEMRKERAGENGRKEKADRGELLNNIFLFK